MRDRVHAALSVVPGGTADAVTVPCTMVDRIVPAASAHTRGVAQRLLGVADLVPVPAEPYSQWVIEDAFATDRPQWEAAGAIVTADVEPWERLKLRALNGVHSAVAYLGALAGEETIDAALALPGMAEVLDRFIACDVAPTLTPPPGADVLEYG